MGISPGESFGKCVALSSNGCQLVVGGPWNDNVVGRQAGHVQVFDEAFGNK